ncbi:DUF2946 family protein [uncultured Deinococcus sp.]|uniref:DUF2946 family protein n=1 Tax=uncultured Deinococcus sp. TaxID=158789 RepID=UPI0025FD1907|nr:DUF2946 family protein [uncultured Deinococcus sp.]
MTRRHAATPLLHRRVLALLAVLASFAFLSRQTVMVAPPRAVDGHAGMAGHHVSAAAHATPAGAALQTPGRGAHDHAAHCPFCFTAAFALGAAPSMAVAGPPTVAAGPVAARVGTPAGHARHADARAPPVA